MFDEEHRSVSLNEILYGSALVATEKLNIKVTEGVGH